MGADTVLVLVAAALVLRPGDGARLRELTRSSTAPAGHVQRARMVLLAAEGLPNAEIGWQVGMTRQTVIAWRTRYEAGGIEALADLPRSGRPPVIDESAIITQTLNPPPPQLAVTHWSHGYSPKSRPAGSPRTPVTTGTATMSSSRSSVRSQRPTHGVKLHVVADNYATHHHPNVKAWLARNPRIINALHPDQRILDEHGRDLLRHHHPPNHPPRHLHQRRRPDRRHPRVHR
jgi:hypothetical protein